MNYNNTYDTHFFDAIDKYSSTDTTVTQSDINSFPYKPVEEITTIDKKILQYCSNHAYTKPPIAEKGLCSFICNMSFRAYAAASTSKVSFLTIGKVLYNDKNIFNVPSKKESITKMVNDIKKLDNIQLGGKLHVWITFDDGRIMDPTILHSINNSKDIILNRPNKLFIENQLQYLPYIVVNIHEIDIDRSLFANKELEILDALKGFIDEDFMNQKT